MARSEIQTQQPKSYESHTYTSLFIRNTCERRTVDGPEMSEHCETDHVCHSHDDDGGQRCVWDVVEQWSEECKRQQHQYS